MARQGKTLPAHRQDATNDSLLIRSAESLGRMIGSLQRQLDGARHLTERPDGAEFRGNGHPRRQRSAGAAAKTQRKTKSSRASDDGSRSATSDRKSKRAAKSAAKKTAGRNRSGAKRRAAKKGRDT